MRSKAGMRKKGYPDSPLRKTTVVVNAGDGSIVQDAVCLFVQKSIVERRKHSPVNVMNIKPID